VAIYHLTVKVISRGRGQSATAAAAYRAGAVLRDERYGLTHRYARQGGVAHAEILSPAGAPDWVYDRETLWNRVEAGERRKDAQLARAVDIGLPVELSQPQCVALVRDYIAQEFVAKGMTADFCIRRADPNNPQLHILLTLREATAVGFGPKMRHWNRKSNLLDWRSAWAERANAHLARAGYGVRIDHRTLEAQRSELTPARKVGLGRGRQGEQNLPPHLQERFAEQKRIARENGAAMVEDPTVALRALCAQRPTFGRGDLVSFLKSRTDDAAQLDAALHAILACEELVSVSDESVTAARYTSRDLLEAEKSLMNRVAVLLARRGREPAARATAGAADFLTEGQRTALEYVIGEGDLKALAATRGDESVFLRAARERWEAHGLRVSGVALSRTAADQLQAATGIAAQALDAREQDLADGRLAATAGDVLVAVGAEMIALKELERMLAVADKSRSKLVLVGDSQQLEAMGTLSPLSRVLARVTVAVPAPG
jgi:Ti-type conjugative transfer relaxase TraA